MLVIILGVNTLNSLSKSKILTEFINNSNNSILIIRGTAKVCFIIIINKYSWVHEIVYQMVCWGMLELFLVFGITDKAALIINK